MINGERVRQVRELRGMTQTELAERIGVTQPFIAQIETGFAQPSEDTINTLADVMHFPPAFFRQEAPIDFPLGSLLYRARAVATASEKWKAYRYAQLLFEFQQQMGRRLSEIPVKIPRLTGNPAEPIDPPQAARMTRAAIGLSPDTPVGNLIRDLERAGVIILRVPVRLVGIDAFAAWAGLDNPKPVIVLSGDTPGDRQRFSVAHEAGHLVMHQAPEGTLTEVEHAADQFAAEFLLPETAMRREIATPVTLTTVAQLKLRWKVSIQALIRRAHDLAIITDRQYRYLFEQLSAFGWRTREPSNLDVPIEKPRALREMAEVLYHKPFDYADLAARLFLPPADLQAMLEAFAGGTEQRESSEGDSDEQGGSGKILPFARKP